MTEQKPSVGRIVHYVSHGSSVRPDGTQAFTSECRAAIVTSTAHVDNGDSKELVDLCVLNPTGFFFNTGCQHDEGQGRRRHLALAGARLTSEPA